MAEILLTFEQVNALSCECPFVVTMKPKLAQLFLALLYTIPLFVPVNRSGEFEALLANLEKQTYDFVQEKVYLHMDKPYYALGDDIWFKAYTVAGPNHTPTPLSQNLFVELVAPEGKVIKRIVLFLNQGMGHGEFALPRTSKPGTYRIRAYTNWMRNFDEAFYFDRQLKVVNPAAGTDYFAEVPSIQPEVLFFPEGGELIEGIPSRIAFEVRGLDTSEPLAGILVDDQGNKVMEVTTTHTNLGVLNLVPFPGKRYFLRFGEDERQYPLPVPVQGGLALSVENTAADEVLVNVKTASPQPLNEAYLIAHTRGIVGFASKLEWKGSVAKVKLPRAKLAPGIVHITLFDKAWQPEAERLVFQRPDPQQFQVQLSTDQASYQSRDSTTVNIEIKDKTGQPVKAFLSLRAIDTEQIDPSAYKEHIASAIWLSTDLGDNIDHPAQYFDPENPNADAHLDLLLMTKGWRRFTWSDLLNDRFPEANQAVQQGFVVTGRLTDKQGNKGVKGTVTYVGNFNGQPRFAEVPADGQGNFKMENMFYYSKRDVLKAKDRKGRSNVRLEIEETAHTGLDSMLTFVPSSEPPKVTERFKQVSLERQQIKRAYDFDSTATDLGTVVVEADRSEEIFANVERGLVFNRGEWGVNVSDIMSNGQTFVSALYVLQGRVPGFNIVMGDAGEPLVQLNRKVWSIRNPDPPIQYYIDDAPASLQAVNALPAESVERIEVLKGMRATGLFGISANGGAIMFYTKTDAEYERYYEMLRENEVVLDQSTRALRSGYYQSREFYRPDYTGEAKKQIKPDRRDLIHWEPMIETDEAGKATVTFFNADLPTNVAIHLEGLWEGGVPLLAKAAYRVEK